MSDVTRRGPGEAPADFSAIETWISGRPESFSFEDAVQACRDAALPGFAPRATAKGRLEALAAFLIAHPSVALDSAHRFHTPRTLAAKGRFVIRLLPSERERGVLLPGHRFIPFVPLPVDPNRLALQRADGSGIPRERILFPRSDAEMCFNFLGRRRDRYLADGPREDLVTVSAFRLAPAGQGSLPHEWVVSCRDFDRGLYSLSPMPAVPHAYGASAVKRLRGALAEVIASPPPGPVDAVRQVFHVVARCLPTIVAHPIGPLGPILANAQECGLVDVDGDPVLTTAAQMRATLSGSGSARGAEWGRTAHRSTALPEEGLTVREFSLIQRALARFSSSLVERSRGYEGRIRDVVWNGRSRTITARVQGSDPRPYIVILSLLDRSGRVERSCSCPYSAGAGDCKHIAALLRAVVQRLSGDSTASLGGRRSVPAARPPAWKLALDRLDAVLQPVSDPDRPAPQRQRVVWRLSRDHRALGITAVIQTLGKSGRWSKGRERALYRLCEDMGEWILPADRSAAAVLCIDSFGGWSYSHRESPTPVFRALAHLAGHSGVFWSDELTRPVCVAVGDLRLGLARDLEGGVRFTVPIPGAAPAARSEEVARAGTPAPRGAGADAGSTGVAGEGADPAGAASAAHSKATAAPPSRTQDMPVRDIIPCEDGCLLIDEPGDRIVVARASAAALAIVDAFVLRPVTIPKSGSEELLSRLPLIEAAVSVDLPAELAGVEIPADRRVRLLLTPDREPGLGVRIGARPLGDGTPLVEPGEGVAVMRLSRPDRREFTRRDLGDERTRSDVVERELGLQRFMRLGSREWRIPDDEAALEFVASLEASLRLEGAAEACPEPGRRAASVRQASPPALPGAAGAAGAGGEARATTEGVVVEWPEDGRRLTLMRDLGAQALRVKIEDRKDWFGLDGEIALEGGSVRLIEVLEAMRRGRRFVPVGDGRWYRISDLLRERLSGIAYLARSDHREIEIGPASAPLIADLVRESGRIEATKAWKEMFRRFEQAMSLNPNPPAGLRGTLRDYQIEGYRWLSRLSAWGVGGCLADDMGLGKTVQALAVLADRADGGPALVVAPTSVASNWIRETRRFFPGLNPVLYRETDRTAPVEAHRAGDLVVISYGLALRDAERLSSVRWGTLVLDEAQFIKNSQTKTAQAIRRIRSDWRLALTGTPLENHLGELWSLFRGVSPGLFGSWERFREEFAQPIEAGKDAGRRKVLSRMVRPFILRRTKGEVLRELPPKTEVRLAAELSPEERKIYDAARLAALARLAQPAVRGGAIHRAAGGAEGPSGLPPSTEAPSRSPQAAVTRGRGPGPEDRRFEVLAALTELRQLACHPRLVYPEITLESAKMRVLMETIDELREEGHRALVFSQFVRHLALVRERLDALKVPYQYLDGSTPPKERDRVVDLFQRGEGDLFLISLKAGGTGLNLTGADYVIHLDPWWNPAVEDQATDRAHRIGQSRSVMVYRIVSTGTIEEQILALHADKRDLVSGVLEGTDAAAKLSTEELIDLIRGGAAAPATATARAQVTGPS
ncbi:MAG: DEAD/DEAH box helicase [Planctomycetes bacterium]|nr:DEAD/DEAH box helicase [Planctomycetota bacterium]